eukprot:CFRG8417T1
MDDRFNTAALSNVEEKFRKEIGEYSENEIEHEVVETGDDGVGEESGSASESGSENESEIDGHSGSSTSMNKNVVGDSTSKNTEQEEMIGGKRKRKSESNSEDECYEEDEDEKELSKKALLKFKSKAEATGVVYLSRIPPYMGPPKIRHFFSKIGPLGRVYLKEEDSSKRKYRVKAGGKRKKMYVEGWVEFDSKKDAKLAALVMNNERVGAYENAVRDKRLELEMRQATKANSFYMDNVAKARMFKDMDERKAAKRANAGEGENKDESKVLRTFRQNPVLK